jgi:hypothetical protein
MATDRGIQLTRERVLQRQNCAAGDTAILCQFADSSREGVWRDSYLLCAYPT